MIFSQNICLMLRLILPFFQLTKIVTIMKILRSEIYHRNLHFTNVLDMKSIKFIDIDNIIQMFIAKNGYLNWTEKKLWSAGEKFLPHYLRIIWCHENTWNFMCLLWFSLLHNTLQSFWEWCEDKDRIPVDQLPGYIQYEVSTSRNSQENLMLTIINN